jgi:hypothetical protein
MRARVVGVDPGGASTGFVAIDGHGVPIHATLVIADHGVNDAYLGEVIDTLEVIVDRVNDSLGMPLVALEDVVHPNPHMGLANMDGLLATAQVLGALRGHLIASEVALVLVRPGGHGSAPLRSYPRQLVGERERKGSGRYRHLRSAYDIARTAAQGSSVLALVEVGA